MHSYMVRTAIKASMYLLPNRDDFMRSIGETGEYPITAASHPRPSGEQDQGPLRPSLAAPPTYMHIKQKATIEGLEGGLGWTWGDCACVF